MSGMKTLHTSYRVTDLDASLRFYSALGYSEVGHVEIGAGATLTMLKLADDEVVTLELAHRPGEALVAVGNGFSHLAIQVVDIARTVESLRRPVSNPAPCSGPAAPTGRRRPGSRILMATASSSCSGRRDTPTGSRWRTSRASDPTRCDR